MSNETNTTTTTTTTNPMITACQGMGMAPADIAYMMLCAGQEAQALQHLGPDALGAAQVRRQKEVDAIATAAKQRNQPDPDPTAVVWGACLDAMWLAGQKHYTDHMWQIDQEMPRTLAEFLAEVVHPPNTFNVRSQKPKSSEGWTKRADGKWSIDLAGTPKGSMGKDVGDGHHLVIRLPSKQQSHK